jgi:hypothetical protein
VLQKKKIHKVERSDPSAYVLPVTQLAASPAIIPLRPQGNILTSEGQYANLTPRSTEGLVCSVLDQPTHRTSANADYVPCVFVLFIRLSPVALRAAHRYDYDATCRVRRPLTRPRRSSTFYEKIWHIYARSISEPCAAKRSFERTFEHLPGHAS